MAVITLDANIEAVKKRWRFTRWIAISFSLPAGPIVSGSVEMTEGTTSPMRSKPRN